MVIDPGFSTMGLFQSDDGEIKYAVVNLRFEEWNSLTVVTGNLYVFETGAFEFIAFIYAGPATVSGVTGQRTIWVSAVSGRARWGDNFESLGNYIPI